MSAAHPVERSQELHVTLTGPVEIRGVVLPAGQYVFRQTGDHIVGVFNEEQKGPLTAFAIVMANADSVTEAAQSNAGEDEPVNVIIIPPPAGDDDGPNEAPLR